MEAKSFDTLVIGSGPAGLLSSIGHSHNSHVTLLEKPEKNNTLGKRILLSGNGRCNFFNEAFFKPEFYQQYPELTPLFEKNIPEKFFSFTFIGHKPGVKGTVFNDIECIVERGFSFLS